MTFYHNNSRKIIPDKFNDYFINVGKILAAEIRKFGPVVQKYLPEVNPVSIFLFSIFSIFSTNELEISNIVIDIKHGVSPSELKTDQILPPNRNNDPW